LRQLEPGVLETVDLCATEIGSNLDGLDGGDRRSVLACPERDHPLATIILDTAVDVVGAKEELLEFWLGERVVIPETRVGRGWNGLAVGCDFGRALLPCLGVHGPTSLCRVMVKTANVP